MAGGGAGRLGDRLLQRVDADERPTELTGEGEDQRGERAHRQQCQRHERAQRPQPDHLSLLVMIGTFPSAVVLRPGGGGQSPRLLEKTANSEKNRAGAPPPPRPLPAGISGCGRGSSARGAGRARPASTRSAPVQNGAWSRELCAS